MGEFKARGFWFKAQAIARPQGLRCEGLWHPRNQAFMPSFSLIANLIRGS